MEHRLCQKRNWKPILRHLTKKSRELVQEAIKNIREKASAVNEEAKKVAEAVSGSLNVEEGKKP